MEEIYLKSLEDLQFPSFKAIRNLAKDSLKQFSDSEKNQFHSELRRGKALLQTHSQLCQYLISYGKMHEAKLHDALRNVPKSFWMNDFEIVDWGCGQAIGSLAVFDFLRSRNEFNHICQVTLIEPASYALGRAEAHVKKAKPKNCEVKIFNEYFEELKSTDLKSSSARPRLHLFSNILDVEGINLKQLALLLDNSVTDEDCIVSVGPIYSSSHRVEAFMEYFDPLKVVSHYQTQVTGFMNRSWTYLARVWNLNSNYPDHLKRLKNYPNVYFTAAYAADLCFKQDVVESIKQCRLHNFAVSAPFDLGGHVYSNLDPLLSVLHNIVVRGVPTRTSPFIESTFEEAFKLTEKKSISGGIEFSRSSQLKHKVKLGRMIESVQQQPHRKYENPELAKKCLQLIYSPLAVARFQKVLIEALITKSLSLHQDYWKVLVIEKDVPFASLALADFKQLFENLCGLLENPDQYQLPEISLSIIGNSNYVDSALHLENEVFINETRVKNQIYDLVVTQAIFESECSDMDNFSQYKCTDKAYFHIRSTDKIEVNRYLYTTDLIDYKGLGVKESTGGFNESSSSVKNLEYFLQLLFRKQTFRPGQIPILDRALRRLPVIGLLPTGGGKSLTYQIAALLQPGLTMVVDPLKSLMKDQYEGLLQVGIDAATFINSSLRKEEKQANELKLESSQVLFTFLSPERLGIKRFRRRLEKMYELDAYFSYGVIDEVHCVSEWGHDFRFNYLHLGRNLYQHVKARKGSISLFGLTATASFDVLADVERELSGNGAFDLDADTIVRFENTNRLELQFKIEKVPISFKENNNYNKRGDVDGQMPQAILADNPFAAFDSKSAYMSDLVLKLPEYLRELIKDESISRIVERFYERQNLESGAIGDRLKLEVERDFWKKRDKYDQAAIVFCPHVNNTGVSVEKNAEQSASKGVEDVAKYSGKDNDKEAELSLSRFRENLSPLMIATKAFGMGIDKPNVRYTINMNYSSSLESFVQEAGRAGRDQKMALATILFSDYKIAQLSRDYPYREEPVGVLFDQWFIEEDLRKILDYYGFQDYEQYLLTADPTQDLVKLHCKVNNQMFLSGVCNNHCSEFSRCQLKNVNKASKGWMLEKELLEKLEQQNLSLGKKEFQYLSPDYGVNMYFYSSSFKGDFIEKTYMNRLLNQIDVSFQESEKVQKGFLDYLMQKPLGTSVIARIGYVPDEIISKEKEYDSSVNRQSDLSKAIYRLTCIGLIDDFTQDYSEKVFSIGLKRKAPGDYYEGLKTFLMRYFTEERAALQIENVKRIELKYIEDNSTKKEIYQCLHYLIGFIYEKISEKRKRAINDIRNFCLIGLENEDWLEANEELKDYIYYYFNSKYARKNHIAPNGEPFSLVDDTDEGKLSKPETVHKYLRVIDDSDPAVESETPLDNIKHLHGAIKLIGRSLTDQNPTIDLLEAFCLAYLDPKGNKALIIQLEEKYVDGMVEYFERLNGNEIFWKLFESFNERMRKVWSSSIIDEMVESIEVLVHARRFKQIKNRYLAKE